MLIPLKQFVCDVCGDVIDEPDQGYVIWRTDDQTQNFDFKIIHQSKCDLQHFNGSMDLPAFLGRDGLTLLLSFLSVGPINNRQLGDKSGPDVKSLDEFVDLIRRVQTPHYEEARQKFGSDDVLERFSDANEMMPYMQAYLKDIASGT